MKINVTADRIARGTRTASMHCPVALAYTEQTGHLCSVSTYGVGRAHLKDLVTMVFYELPRPTVLAIQLYDRTGEMEPCIFDMPISPGGPAVTTKKARSAGD